MSIEFTKDILNRLIECNPLTPIEDSKDIWKGKGYKEYQCKRMASFFKKVYTE